MRLRSASLALAVAILAVAAVAAVDGALAGSRLMEDEGIFYFFEYWGL
jgi:hypothetical protein